MAAPYTGAYTPIDPTQGVLDAHTGSAASQPSYLSASALAGQQQAYTLQQLANQLFGQQQLAGQQISGQQELQKQSFAGQQGLQTSAQQAAAALQAAELGSRSSLQEKQLAEQQKEALIGQQTAEYAPGLQQKRFESVFPYLQNMLGNFQSHVGMGGTGGGGPGYVSAGYPVGQGLPGGYARSSSVAIGPGQLDAQLNQQHAQGEQSVATMTRNMQSALGARGYAAGSPLAQALAGQFAGQNMQAQALNESQARLEAGKLNAAQSVAAAQAGEQYRSNLANEQIAQMAPYFSTQNALISALAGLV